MIEIEDVTLPESLPKTVVVDRVPLGDFKTPIRQLFVTREILVQRLMSLWGITVAELVILVSVDVSTTVRYVEALLVVLTALIQVDLALGSIEAWRVYITQIKAMRPKQLPPKKPE